MIPWLVQKAAPGQTHCDPDWQTVEADTSRGAVVAWLEAHWLAGELPVRIRVAPAAKILRHPNGMPMLSREFNVTAAEGTP